MIKKIIVQIATILAGGAFISGCAPMVSGAMNLSLDENSMLEKTASYFAVTRENIKLSSIDKGALSTSYQAQYLGKIYSCSIYYGAVNCNQPGTPIDLGVKAGAGSRLTTPVVVSEAPAQVVTNNRAMSAAQAQARLNQLGYPVGVPDGVFGKKSVEKLKMFQLSRGLAVSGELDSPTIAALR